MKLKHLCMAIVAMAAFTACSDDNNEQPKPQPGEGVGKFEGIVFATSIPNADGSSGAAYLQGIPKLTTNPVDNSKGLPTGPMPKASWWRKESCRSLPEHRLAMW